MKKNIRTGIHTFRDAVSLLLIFSVLALSACSDMGNMDTAHSLSKAKDMLSAPENSSSWSKKMLGGSTNSSSWKEKVLDDSSHSSTWNEKMLGDSTSSRDTSTSSMLFAK